ncbi:MAG: hypothetical protein ABWK05_04155 [Pyrobaculum sp.]
MCGTARVLLNFYEGWADRGDVERALRHVKKLVVEVAEKLGAGC